MKKNNNVYVGEEPLNVIIKMDYKKARKFGIKGSDLQHIRDLGFNVLNLERFPKSYFALFEVSEYNKKKIPLSLPPYLERLAPFWNFEKQYPL